LLCVQKWRTRGGGDALKRIANAFVSSFIDVSAPTRTKTPRTREKVFFATWRRENARRSFFRSDIRSVDRCAFSNPGGFFASL